MKHIAKSLVLVGAMVSAGGAAAAFFDGCDWCPYAGVDYKQLWVKGKGFWHNKFAKSYPGATLYLGTKFTECFGAEIGYSWTTRKHKTAGFGRHHHHNGTFNNNFVTINGTTINLNDYVVRTGVRFNSFHFDLNGYYPLDACWELIGSVGVASMKPKVNARIRHRDFRNQTTSTVITTNNALIRDWFGHRHGKSKAVWRLGVGTQYLFNECFGTRLMFRWEGTESLRVGRGHHHHHNNGTTTTFTGTGFNGNFHHFHSKKAFRNAVSLAWGLFVKF